MMAMRTGTGAAALDLDLAQRHPQRRLDGGAGTVRQRPSDLHRLDQAEQVGAGDAQQLLPAHPAGSGDRRLPPVVAPDDGEHPLVELSPRTGHQLVVVGEHRDRLRRRDRTGRRRSGCSPAGGPAARQRRPRRAAAGGTTACCRASRDSSRNESSPASGSAASANQPSIAGSSVRWIAARRRDPVGQRLEVAQRAGRVVEPEREQPRAGLGRAEPRLVAVQPGHGGEQRPVEQLLVQPADLAAVPCPVLLERQPPRRRGSRSPGPPSAATPGPRAPGGCGCRCCSWTRCSTVRSQR